MSKNIVANTDIDEAYIRDNAKINTYGVKVWVCVASQKWARKWARMVNGGRAAFCGHGSSTVWEIVLDMTSEQYEARRLSGIRQFADS